MMTPDDWVLLGYRAREKCPKPDWLNVDNVEEIASVSTCIVPSIAVPWTPQAQNMMGSTRHRRRLNILSTPIDTSLMDIGF